MRRLGNRLHLGRLDQEHIGHPARYRARRYPSPERTGLRLDVSIGDQTHAADSQLAQDLKCFKPSPDSHYQHINDLFTKDAVDWELIARHLPDMLQVAQSIKAGCISPSTILRRLGTASRKNRLYYAFRKLGRVVRTTFLLEYLSDADLRRLIHAATNKCEAFNKFAKWAYFAEDVVQENVRDEQIKIIKYNHLIANLLIFHNTYSITQILKELEREGMKLSPELLGALSPYRTSHINRFGTYEFRDREIPDVDYELKLETVTVSR